MSRIHILGAGAFGRALAAVYAGHAGRDIRLYARTPRDGAQPFEALAPGAGDLVLACVPAAATAEVLGRARLPGHVPLILTAKGIAADGALQSDIAARQHRGTLAALTGPSLAAEIARGLPTALTLACADRGQGAKLQAALSTPTLRLYLTPDVRGAQIGGALKNVYAIACGAAMGAGLGESARAALMTRGFAEMTRLGCALGGQAETFAGLSGLGDLALSCASPASRNFALGQALGAGHPPQTVTQEGRATAGAARALAQARGIDAPVIAAVADLVAGAITVREAMTRLLSRPLTDEG